MRYQQDKKPNTFASSPKSVQRNPRNFESASPVEEDRIEYPGKVATKTADIVTAKIIFNSVLSTKDVRFMTINISNFYLNTPTPQYEYMRIPISAIPDIIMEQYQLTSLVHNGFVMVEISKRRYGLPQAGLITNERLVKHLATYGFHPTKHTHDLFTHEIRPGSFCLVVDDFGVKYVGKEHAQHLVDALESLYDITTEWPGKQYLALTLQWDYQKGPSQVSA
jgi:hypothetical protein